MMMPVLLCMICLNIFTILINIPSKINVTRLQIRNLSHIFANENLKPLISCAGVSCDLLQCMTCLLGIRFVLIGNTYALWCNFDRSLLCISKLFKT